MLMFKNRLVKNVEIDGVSVNDYPDFCDAYFSYAEWENGTPLTDDELYELTSEHGDVVNEMAHDGMQGYADDAYDRWKDAQYD